MNQFKKNNVIKARPSYSQHFQIRSSNGYEPVDLNNEYVVVKAGEGFNYASSKHLPGGWRLIIRPLQADGRLGDFYGTDSVDYFQIMGTYVKPVLGIARKARSFGRFIKQQIRMGGF